MVSKFKAFVYALFHPRPIALTVVRRYLDAKANFIGELYLDGKMIGMSCDSLPYAIGALPEGTVAIVQVHFDLEHDFTTLMPPNTIRAGGNTPEETKAVRKLLLSKRYCKAIWNFHNRFIEHVMEKDIAARD